MLLKLHALVVGQGSVVPLAIDGDECVGELKKKICEEQQYSFPASGLTLYEAAALAPHQQALDHAGGGGGGATNPSSKWLRADDPDAKRMKKGGDAPAPFLEEDREMDPTYPLSDFFSGANAPRVKEIHILVVLPRAVVAPGHVVAPAPVVVPAPVVAPTPIATPVVAPVTPPAQKKTTKQQRKLVANLSAEIAQVAIGDSEPDAREAAGDAPVKPVVAREKKKPRKDKKDKPPTRKAVVKQPSPAAAILSKRSTPATNPDEKRKLQTTTWSFKASALFFYFHAGLGNQDLVLTCDAFEIITGTFRNWLTKKEFYPKWVPFVEEMTLKDAMEFIPAELHAQLQISELHPDAKVTIPEKYLKAGSKRLRSDHQASIQSTLKKPRVTITAESKTIGSGRIAKYPVQEAFLMEQVRVAWETGNPLTTAQIYVLLTKEFGRPEGEDGFAIDYVQSEFETRMGIDSGKTAAPFSQWVSRRLETNNWNVKARKVAPKVPTNWYELAIKTSTELRALMRDVDVLINADEIFMSFYPREPQFVANQPGNAAAESKKGCTVVLSCELFSSMLLPPFIIMSGARNGTLARTYDAWIENGGNSEICFQPSHWMDVRGAKKYLDFVAAMFPRKQIGLIWDTASSHVNQEILDYISELGIIVGFIPSGVTSAMQVCDHACANKRIQNEIKEQFCNWKVEQSLIPLDGKHRVARSDLIKWIENAVTKPCESSKKWEIKKMFQKLGQDPRSSSETNSEFLDHLRTLSAETLAAALLETQLALDLE